MRGLSWLWNLIIDHVDKIGLGELTGVLAWHLLSMLQVIEKSLLLSIEVDVLTKQGIDLLPLVMLAVGVHRAHLWTTSDDA